MTIHLQEVVRSEVEGGLTGPANPIPNESIDCGSALMPCSKLAKFATRRLFIGLLSWIGLIQAAAYGYFYVAGPTIARRFQFDPYLMEWVLAIPDLIPFLLGILIAYWGDRIHRAAWVGSIVLLQSASYIIMIIPHFTHQTKVVDETEDMMRTVYEYADDNRELCSRTATKIVAKDDEPCYFTFAALVVVQIITGIANISYYALAISYLDDNTRKKHVAGFIGIAIAVKIVGVLLGFMLAWVCLRLDAVTLTTIDTYREHIGAWWLGLPILTLLLLVPGLLLSWFPRMLPSQVVERAAVALLANSLDRPSRMARRLVSENPENSGFLSSVGRLFANKILILIVLAYTLYMLATVNFMAYENLIIQARFHLPKPTGLLLGFNDPIVSRLVTNVLKPILIGLLVMLSGLIMSKAKPSARGVVAYGIVITILATGIVVALTLTSCEKRPIVETDDKGHISLPTYCNRNCSCSNDADFRPVCESKGTVTYYSPCHAGCHSSEYKNGRTVYSNCNCVENTEMYDGPCDENACQAGWVMFELGTMFLYALIATMFIGDFLIVLRSGYKQDKAISIGFWMMWSAVIINVGGKFLYDTIAELTCHYWGTQKTKCHLHQSLKLGDYLCYLTATILVLSILIKVVLWYLCKHVKLYAQQTKKTSTGTAMQQLMSRLANKRTQPPISGSNNNNTAQVEVTNESASRPSEREEEQRPNESVPLKYGPLGPGDRRTGSKSSLSQASHSRRSDIRNLDSEDDLSSSGEEAKKDSSPKVAYRPLDIDSDVESDLSNTAPRSRKRIHMIDYNRVFRDPTPSVLKPSSKREFPDPANYDDPRLTRRLESDQNGYVDGSWRTNSFEYAKKHKEREGDFNEVGIPVVVDNLPKTPDAPGFVKDVKSLINRYEHKSDQPDGDDDSIESTESGRSQYKVVAGIPLVAMASARLSRGPSSSRFSSFNDSKHPEDRPESRQSNSPKKSVDKGSKGTLHTDF